MRRHFKRGNLAGDDWSKLRRCLLAALLALFWTAAVGAGAQTVSGPASGILTNPTGTLGVSNGGTGDTGTAWAAYTPTMACGTGSFTTVTPTGAWKTIGKTTFVRIKNVITTNGTCASYTTASLPNTPLSGSAQAGIGFNITTGVPVIGKLSGSGSLAVIQTMASAYSGADGQTLVLSLAYESN